MVQKIKALVVDDSAIMRKVIIGVLTQMNIDSDHITQAADGVEAVQSVKDNEFDIIIMDWNMPNMLGIDAVTEIRNMGNNTPILMVTTEAERTNVVRAIQAGANNYLVKPFNGEELRMRVEQLILATKN